MSFALRKEVTEKEIKSGRISLPARVRDDIFPWVAEKSKTYTRMVDEKGISYDIVLKVRKKRTKPELMAKGGKKFAQKRSLKPGDVLVFSRGESPNHFRVEVQRWLSLSPPGPPIGSCHAKHLLSLSSTGRIKAEEQEMAGLTLELSVKPPICFLKDKFRASESVVAASLAVTQWPTPSAARGMGQPSSVMVRPKSNPMV